MIVNREHSSVMILRPNRIPSVDPAELRAFFSDAERRIRSICPDGYSKQSVELVQFFFDAEFRLKLAIASQQEIDQKLATGFNVFLLIEPDENKLSDILADLLNPAGKHGQRDQFLRLFLGMLAFSPAHNLADITTVRREAPTGANFNHRRRIDILVDAGALIAIENKVDSPEQPDQARDYLEDLDERAREASAVGAFIYLSPDGRHPGSITKTLRSNNRSPVSLHSWSYQKEIRRWLCNCRDHCESQRIRDFLSNFIDYINSKLKPRWEETETQSNESRSNPGVHLIEKRPQHANRCRSG